MNSDIMELGQEDEKKKKEKPNDWLSPLSGFQIQPEEPAEKKPETAQPGVSAAPFSSAPPKPSDYKMPESAVFAPVPMVTAPDGSQHPMPQTQQLQSPLAPATFSPPPSQPATPAFSIASDNFSTANTAQNTAQNIAEETAKPVSTLQPIAEPPLSVSTPPSPLPTSSLEWGVFSEQQSAAPLRTPLFSMPKVEPEVAQAAEKEKATDERALFPTLETPDLAASSHAGAEETNDTLPKMPFDFADEPLGFKSSAADLRDLAGYPGSLLQIKPASADPFSDELALAETSTAQNNASEPFKPEVAVGNAGNRNYAPANPETFINNEDVSHLRTYFDGEIERILSEHEEWLQSGGRTGKRANFRQANLRGFNLSGAVLVEASFRGASLVGANLSQCDLRGADLSEMDGRTVNFSYANLEGAILSRADLREAQLEGAHIATVDFSNAQLEAVNMSGLNLFGSIFMEANLQRADLSYANLSTANMRSAQLSRANLDSADLSEANLRDANCLAANFNYARMDGASLKNANFQEATMLGVDLAVAAETSPEQRLESTQKEREVLQQEITLLKQQQVQLAQQQQAVVDREYHLQQERQQFERQRRDLQEQHDGVHALLEQTNAVMQRHHVYDRRFRYLAVLWFIFTMAVFSGIIAFVSSLDFSHLNPLEVGTVAGSALLILGLFIMTTVSSIKLSANMKRLTDMYVKYFPKK